MFLLRDLVSPRTWLALTQHLVGLVLGFAAIFIVTFGLGFGFGGLFFALAGLPLLGVTLRLADWFARAERARFGFLTGMRIPAWPAPAGRAGPSSGGASSRAGRRGPSRPPGPRSATRCCGCRSARWQPGSASWPGRWA